MLIMVTALGTGVFTLHKCFVRIGMINASILLFIVGYLMYYGSILVIHASRKNPEVTSLPNLVEKLLGYKVKLIYNVIFIMTLLINALGGFLAFSKCFYNNFKVQIWNVFPIAQEN